MNVLIGISASVAAHRALDLASALRKQGHETAAVLSANAARLVSTAAIEAITGRRAVSTLWAPEHSGNMDHLALTKWADVFVICPASANTIANLATGLAPDALSTMALAWPTHRPLLIAPAMNPQMWAHPATRKNVDTLEARGARFIGPVSGETACRDFGIGRLAPVEDILHAALAAASSNRPSPLTGKTILVTGGPTAEALDPVRMLTNPSSGKMAVALAQRAHEAGATVHLVLGPCPAANSVPAGIAVEHVRCAEEMLQAVQRRLSQCDAVIFAAAVSDFRPVNTSASKLSKAAIPPAATMTIEFERTPDIALEASRLKRPAQVFVGFCADTYSPEEEAAGKPIHLALDKAARKSFDLVFSNPVGRPGTGFQSGDNAGWLIQPLSADSPPTAIPEGWNQIPAQFDFPSALVMRLDKQPKSSVAAAIVSRLATLLQSPRA